MSEKQIGQAGLIIRILLYALGGMIAGQGWGSLDAEAGTLTLNIEPIATILGGTVMTWGTFIVSRIIKSKGGHT